MSSRTRCRQPQDDEFNKEAPAKRSFRSLPFLFYKWWGFLFWYHHLEIIVIILVDIFQPEVLGLIINGKLLWVVVVSIEYSSIYSSWLYRGPRYSQHISNWMKDAHTYICSYIGMGGSEWTMRLSMSTDLVCEGSPWSRYIFAFVLFSPNHRYLHVVQCHGACRRGMFWRTPHKTWIL